MVNGDTCQIRVSVVRPHLEVGEGEDFPQGDICSPFAPLMVRGLEEKDGGGMEWRVRQFDLESQVRGAMLIEAEFASPV